MPTTYYVSPSGTQNGLLSTTPSSVSNAITNSISGDTIYFLNGTYTLNLNLNKSLILQGQSLSNVLLKAPTNSTSATILLNNGTSNTTIKNMKITGKFVSQSNTGSGDTNNNNSAILTAGTTINNLIFENLEIYGASFGIHLNNTISNNILINNCIIRNNESAGIRIASNVSTCNGFTIGNCTIKENNGPAITTNPAGNYRPNCTNYNIINSSILDNNRLTLNNSHDISIFGFNGNINITNVTINCKHQEYKSINGTSSNLTTGGHALSIIGRNDGSSGAGPYYPLGNINIENLTITGTIIKSSIIIERYSTLNTVTFNNVSLKDSIPNIAQQTWNQIHIGHTDNIKAFLLGNTKVTTITTTNSGNVDTRNVLFYDNNNKSVLLNKMNGEHCLKIKQQLTDKSIFSNIGTIYTDIWYSNITNYIFNVSVYAPFNLNTLQTNILFNDLTYTKTSGIAYGVNTGYTGSLAILDFTILNSNNIQYNQNSLICYIYLPMSNINNTIKLYKLNENNKIILNFDPITLNYINNNTYSFQLPSLDKFIIRDSTSLVMGAGGDPHISTINGEHILLPNEWKLVKLYEHNDFKVIVKCEHISDELVDNLHKFDEYRNIISIDKKIHKYVTNLTYITELSILKNNEEVFNIDMLNNNILLHNEESEVKLEKIEDDEGLFSLTHKRIYPKYNLSSYQLYLNNNNVLKLQVDNFWDDINFVKLHLFDKEHLDEYSGEFFKHDENNKLK